METDYVETTPLETTEVVKKSRGKKIESTLNLDEFDLSNCQKCRLCETRTQVVQPQIVENCDYLLIGEAPGANEDFEGTPFIGKAGQLLDELLQKVGIDRNKCTIVNSVQCRPPKNRQPQKDEIELCDPYVKAVIKKANPKVIIPLGAIAFKKFIGKGTITALNGTINEVEDYPNTKIVPAFHPAYCLRDPKATPKLEMALKKATEAIQGNIKRTLSKVTIINDLSQFDQLIAELESSKIFALDIETSGFDWQNDFITCISFSTKEGYSWVLPWVVGDDKYYEFCRNQVIPNKNARRPPIDNIKKFCSDFNLNFPEFKWKDTYVKEKLKTVLSNPKIMKILHNFAFDYKFLENNDLKIEGHIYDTMIIHYLIDETKKTHGLKDLSHYYTSYGKYDDALDAYKKNDDSYAIIPIEILFPYAGTDADVTLILFNLLYPKLKQEQQEHLYNSFILNLVYLLMETEKTGAKVDLELIETYKSLLNNKIQELDKTIKEKYGNWNYNSNPQLANFLFNQLKLPILEKTPTGRPKCDEVVLEKLSAVCELPKYLLEIRKYKKALSTYVEGLRKSVWKDGKIHTQFLVHGTETGRLSSIKPNFQNWPRFDPKSYLGILGINIKNLVVSSDDDYYIVETDYSQAELRLIAEYSRDNNLYNAFLNDRDPHAELAVRLYHKEYIADMESGKVSAKELYKKGIITKEERTKGKTANFSLCYGKFAENFAKEENIPLEEAREIHRVYWETYPGITSWKERTLEEGRKNGYFKSFFGRKRRLPNINSEDKFLRGSAEREGINFVIQSQASDYTLYSTIKVMKKAKELGLNCRNISFVHDSAVYEVKKSDIQEFLNILQDIMTKCVGVSLKMEAEVKIGNRLGSCKEWIKKDGVWQENKK